jgi:hypothetical protein
MKRQGPEQPRSDGHPRRAGRSGAETAPRRPASHPATAAAVALALAAGPAVVAAPAHAVTAGMDFFAAFAAEVAQGIPAAAVPPSPTTTRLSRLAPPAYADGFAAPAGPHRPSPRAISDAISIPALRLAPDAPLSTLSVALLQLLTSHTHARTPTATDPAEALHVPTHAADPIAGGSPGAPVLSMQRSLHEGGIGPGDPREQINVVTPRLDGSAI